MADVRIASSVLDDAKWPTDSERLDWLLTSATCSVWEQRSAKHRSLFNRAEIDAAMKPPGGGELEAVDREAMRWAERRVRRA